MEHEHGGDRAVIIVSALVAILSSSTSVSKDNIGTCGIHNSMPLKWCMAFKVLNKAT